MRVCDFKKIINEKKLERVIGLYMHEKINLTEKQLNKILELKTEKNSIGWKRGINNG